MAKVVTGKKPKDLGYTLSRLFGYMGMHRFLLIAVAFLVLASVAGNLLGTYMIKPVINSLIEHRDAALLARGVAITAVVYLLGALASLGYTQIMCRLAAKTIYDIRRDLFAHMQSLSLSFFDRESHGDIMSCFTNDSETISEALSSSFTAVMKNLFQLIGTMAILIALSWELALVTIAFTLLMSAIISYSSKRSKAYYRMQQKELGALDGYIEEMMNGQRTVKVLNHEKRNTEGFLKRNESLRRAGTGAQAFSATMIPAVVSLGFIDYAAVSALGGFMVIKGLMDIGSLSSYLVFVRQSTAPINQFTQQMNALLSALAGAERIFHILDEKSETDEGDTALVRTEDGGWAWQKDDGVLVPLRGDVRFCNVSFSYIPGKRVLDDISLYAKPGQKIAFVGSTGAGKTTITNLLNRFYDVDEGVILFDGIDIRDIRKKDLRRTLAFVLQDTHLFSGTIRENIRFGNSNASDADVVRAAVTANADSFISRLPAGYDTCVRGDGENLSQGQRQLLSIARSAVADPPVLILDEATSSVDTRTEDQIEKGMDTLMEGRTVFVIAHRLSTVRNADAIMVLENGRIIERGDHDDLIAQKGVYFKLYSGAFTLS